MFNKELTIEHAKFGLTNAQETIRFVDTKIGVVLTFLIFLCGGAFHWAGNSEILTAMKDEERVVWVVGVASLGFLACFVVAVWFCFEGLTARMPQEANARDKYSVLFPYIPLYVYRGKNRGKQQVFKKRVDEYRQGFSKICAGMETQMIAREFADQFMALGFILHRKVSACRNAIKWLLWVLFCVIILNGIAITFQFCQKEEANESDTGPNVAASAEKTWLDAGRLGDEK